MTYTYKQIQKNTDLILIQTIDVVWIYNAFRKILLKLELSDKELYHYLTFSLFKRNDTFTENIQKFVVALGYLLVSKAKDNKFVKIKNNLTNFHIISFNNVLANEQISQDLYQVAKELFSFINLDGSARDLVSLVQDFDLFTKEQILEIEKITLIFTSS
ncbi:MULTISPECIES: hypothetical protein [unclassified Mycoplasma]|uniref:hypothetical protein n=1 Tax=unclassified Mycoplasma TaxID=2683645 RepID=UPI00211B9D9E|nr:MULTISPECIES: hypothetical protein [unclassified Mycoplasma]UUM19762.1 hypothetical protein NPA11_03265 [Mycoplasma sp. 1578d]UUM24745.1 hypothetical protein NPA12_03555 [Mycoplasma sp. 3686d]